MTANRSLLTSDFRGFLQHTFLERCRKNPQYSLRAFAKSLGIQPSPLSAILRGKRPITPKMKARLALALGLHPSALATEKSAQENRYQQISLDTFAVISDWYHYAILELIRVEGFRPDPQHIAKALGIRPNEVHIAVERLQRVGLLKIDASGRWIDTSADGLATNIDGDLTSQASRQLQKQLLELSLKALDELSPAVRNHTSMTMAVHAEDLGRAKERIRKFRRDFCRSLEKNANPTHVYNLSISFFPLSTRKDEP